VVLADVGAGWRTLHRGGGPESPKSCNPSSGSRLNINRSENFQLEKTVHRARSAGPRKITGLSEHHRKPGRYRVEVDGKAIRLPDGKSALVDVNLVLELKLRIGSIFDEAVEAAVLNGALRLATYDRALNALTSRARSAKELERWLANKKQPKEFIAPTIEKLTELGFLNDAEFAKQFARSRAVGRKMSKRLIQAELAKRGVARDLADRAVSEIVAEEQIDERAQAQALAAKKMRSLAKLAPEVQRRRLYGFLARKGYSPDLVMSAVRALTAEPRITRINGRMTTDS
jgi:regulatory protein